MSSNAMADEPSSKRAKTTSQSTSSLLKAWLAMLITWPHKMAATRKLVKDVVVTMTMGATFAQIVGGTREASELKTAADRTASRVDGLNKRVGEVEVRMNKLEEKLARQAAEEAGKKA
ncbi:hypothetical protein MVLG_03970 [Microbotryum lychnidis-dioicae p1A1 Lamole]|uniref:Uncharacterized protein n=1 Tax=Microbotryum lychnidis-dioicae (strain p1A1 Lamole / MvSl-1064) TaxID=683840 RepID=U5H9T2_USTV1|nr:hypothetical protein MVLG_03970 [Microbotryum lychnidis-dioicae p1A1 Lamole]|eukprot:KDE05737.1 hypothetical protein MVLG_03970 [Microbotryum lychnidis-dioicae p1A1 Lamole]